MTQTDYNKLWEENTVPIGMPGQAYSRFRAITKEQFIMLMQIERDENYMRGLEDGLTKGDQVVNQAYDEQCR